MLKRTRHSDLRVQQNRARFTPGLRRTFWAYRRTAFAGADNMFEPHEAEGRDPVVFRAPYASRNLLTPPSARPEIVSGIEAMIASHERHRDFGSMRGSQALAQSIFAGLAILDRLDALANVTAEDGFPAFFDKAGHTVILEHQVSALGEPRPTSVDAFFFGATKWRSR